MVVTICILKFEKLCLCETVTQTTLNNWFVSNWLKSKSSVGSRLALPTGFYRGIKVHKERS